MPAGSAPATTDSARHRAGPNRHVDDEAIVAWLVEGDPSLRWQVMQDLIGAPADQVLIARERVAVEGA